jgi:glycerol-3-phosphate O-acyltransferase
LNKIYEWIDRIWQWIAETVFVRFEFDLPVEDLKKLESEGKLVFSIVQGGIFEYFIISSWCRSQGFGAILIANRKRVLLLAKPLCFLQILFGRKTYADLFLSSEPGPRLLFCPAHERKKPFVPTPVEKLLCELFAAEKFIAVPFLILWRKHVRGATRKLSEYFFGLGSKPNLIGKIWYLARQRKDSIVRSLGAFPIRSKELAELPDPASGENDSEAESEAMKAAKLARRRILVATNQELRVVLGPRYLSPHSVKETLLRDPDIQSLVTEIAAKEGVDRKKIMMRAYKDLNEIVASYNYRTIEVMYVLLTWVFTRVFDGVIVEDAELQKVREIMKTKPVVFIPCHRSHLDYLVIPYVLFLHDIVTPHIAAGINLAFWPAGPFMRSGGAFFIRRSFRGDALYSTALRKYIEYLLKNRWNIKFFIEGTRSRSGKMLPPAYGLLKNIMEAYRHKVCDDIALVPVSICYDEIPEQGTYSKELAGAQKKKESVRGLLRSRKVIKKKIGKVYVRFAEPIFVKDVFKLSEELHFDSTLMLQKTAFQVCKEINDVTYITPKALVSSVLVGHRLPTLSLQEILRASQMLGAYATSVGAPLSLPVQDQFKAAVEQTMRALQRSAIVGVSEGSMPRTFYCEPKKRVILNFYKNNTIHCFVIPSIFMVAFFSTLTQCKVDTTVRDFRERVIAKALMLRNILKFEFFFSPTQEFLKEMENTARYFLGPSAFEQPNLAHLITTLRGHLGSWDDASLYMRLLGELLNSFLSGLNFMKQNPGSTPLEKRSFVQKILKLAESGPQEDVVFPESMSTQNYSNALLIYENLKLLSISREGEKSMVVVQAWDSKSQDLMDAVKHFLELMDENLINYLRQRGFQVSEAVEQTVYEPTFPL